MNPSFTFHFGAINTRRVLLCKNRYPYFTFHFGAINTQTNYLKGFEVDTLHSTLEPLILKSKYLRTIPAITLHSTLEPLILRFYNPDNTSLSFTFHFGAINTCTAMSKRFKIDKALHSTLEPLIPFRLAASRARYSLYIPLWSH